MFTKWLKNFRWINIRVGKGFFEEKMVSLKVFCISLLSIISKVLERCIFNNIKYHVYEQLSHTQYGFMPGKSCITQLVEVLDRI